MDEKHKTPGAAGDHPNHPGHHGHAEEHPPEGLESDEALAELAKTVALENPPATYDGCTPTASSPTDGGHYCHGWPPPQMGGCQNQHRHVGPFMASQVDPSWKKCYGGPGYYGCGRWVRWSTQPVPPGY